MLSECGVPVFETDLDRLVSEGIADGLLTIHADNQEAVDDAQVVIIALPTLYADGSQTRSFCYVDDVVDGLIYLADSSAAEPDNLGNPNEMSVSDFADVVANLVGDTGRIYKDLPVSDPVRRQPDISLALSELGWEPVVPLVDGLQRTTAYLRDVQS